MYDLSSHFESESFEAENMEKVCMYVDQNLIFCRLFLKNFCTIFKNLEAT